MMTSGGGKRKRRGSCCGEQSYDWRRPKGRGRCNRGAEVQPRKKQKGSEKDSLGLKKGGCFKVQGKKKTQRSKRDCQLQNSLKKAPTRKP